MKNGSHEFGIATQVMFHEKAQVLDYTFPIYNNLEILASRIPIKLASYQNVFWPFPANIWLAFLLSCCAGTLVFVLAYKTYRHIDLNFGVEDKLTLPGVTAGSIQSRGFLSGRLVSTLAFTCWHV